MPVYDDQRQKKGTSNDELRGITGISPDEEEAMDREAHSGAAEDIGQRSLSPNEIAEKEEGAEPRKDTGGEEEQSLFKDDGSGANKKKFWTRRRKAGGGVIGLFVGGGVLISVLTLPALKLEHFMQNINQKAFAVAANAVEARAGHLMERYMVSYMTQLNTCTQTVSLDCRYTYRGAGIAGNLFNQWRDARVEQKLFDNYGIEIRTEQDSDTGITRHRLYDTKLRSEIDLSRDVDGKFRNIVTDRGRRDFGREMNRFLRQETKIYQVMERRSIRKYLQRKHDVRLWCFWACDTRDNLEDRSASARTRYKYRFVSRFVYPFSSKYGLIFTCAIDRNIGSRANSCGPNDLRERDLDRNNLSEEDRNDIIKHFRGTDENGKPLGRSRGTVSSYVLEKLLAKVMKDSSARLAATKIPVAGQLYFVASMALLADDFDRAIDDDALSRFHSALAAEQYREIYTGFRSLNDETKSHEVDLNELGAALSDLDGAEKSKLWRAYSNQQNNDVAFLGSSTVHAQSDEEYTCQDGEPIDRGDHVCDEKKIVRGPGDRFEVEKLRDNPVVDRVASAVNTLDDCVTSPPGVEIVVEINAPCPADYRFFLERIVGAVDFVLSSIGSVVFGLVSNIRGYDTFEEWAKNLFDTFLTWVFSYVFPLPVQEDSPARVKLDGVIAGADVTSAEFAEGGYDESGQPYGLGAPVISDEEYAKITKEQLEQQRQNFRKEDLLTRLASLEHPQSLASGLVGSIPIGQTQGTGAIFGIMNGFKANLRNAFTGSVGADSLAEQQLAINAFGITRYGYSQNDPAFTRNPDQLTEESCEEYKERWEESGEGNENPYTGLEEKRIANPCLLEEAAVEAAGAYFTNE
ncbi:MAG: hypothetical protein U5L95_01935 [Candidatus Saccharibacteria bacterium]|nr:hypothetical protein [Candidatus Saccharibacteria bacterium]